MKSGLKTWKPNRGSSMPWGERMKGPRCLPRRSIRPARRSEEHTSELQSPCNLVCRLLLEKKKQICRPSSSLRTAPYRPCYLGSYTTTLHQSFYFRISLPRDLTQHSYTARASDWDRPLAQRSSREALSTTVTTTYGAHSRLTSLCTVTMTRLRGLVTRMCLMYAFSIYLTRLPHSLFFFFFK